jgi:glycosyltransferase involved in cell wall biosynthesis
LKIKKNYYLNIKAISVIIPIYNSEKYLEDCLNSIINQTLKRIEIICIDDGSTDNSSKILENYKKLDDRFVIFRHKHKGSGFSRNIGINNSKGKFVSFLDSDDMYANNFALQNIFEKANKYNAIICGGGIKRLINNGTYKTFEFEGFIKYEDYQVDFEYQRFIYKKNFLIKNHLKFPNYIRYQDPPFFNKTMANAKLFYAIKNLIYIRRAIPKNYNKKQTIDIFYGMNDCLKLAEKMNLYKLYKNILCRFNSKYLVSIAKKFSNDDKLRSILIKILMFLKF